MSGRLPNQVGEADVAEHHMFQADESVAVQPVQAIFGGVGVESEFPHLFDIELGVEDDNQVERNACAGVLNLLVQ